jgi:hypothetical protein
MEEDKKKKPKMIKEIPFGSAHLRWNVEKSEDNFYMDVPLQDIILQSWIKETLIERIADKIINTITEKGFSVLPVGSSLSFKLKKENRAIIFGI